MASTGEAWRLGRRPALDGLRGVAVLLVLLTHTTEFFVPALTHLGGVGVTVFFTLSGFLITSLLLEERNETGRIDLIAFYLRRARRLLPALAAMLLVVAALGVVAWQAVAAVALYVGNWYGASHEFGWLNHTWSLAVEEQFYLLWPLAVIAMRSRRVVLWTALAGAVASFAARLVAWDGTGETAHRIEWWTHTRADALLLGCALAALLHGRRTSPVAAGLVPALLAGVLFSGFLGHELFAVVWMPLAVAALTVGLLWLLVQTNSEPRWLAAGPMAWLGRRSYGLYLWHIPVINLLISLAVPPWFLMVGGVCLSIGVSAASWRWIESPFLDRPVPTVTGAYALPGSTGTAERGTTSSQSSRSPMPRA